MFGAMASPNTRKPTATPGWVYGPRHIDSTLGVIP
jgi:hypothetical protein